MLELTAIQKVRLAITGHPDKEPEFQHEGPAITRWITGGTTPTAYVRFREQENQIVAFCPQCQKPLGVFDAEYGENTYQSLGTIRKNGIEHQRQHKAI